MTRTWMILMFAAVLGTVPTYGHHSFAVYYLEDQAVSLEGELMALDYVNPHAWVHVAAADTAGRVHRVSAEWSNPGRLKRQGITRDTLKPGDRVIVTGSPARDPSEYKMHLKRIERPADGWKWIGQGQRF